LIEDIHQNERDQAIVGTIIDLAHTLGIAAIAAGVESEEQLVTVANLACDCVQGNYVSLPATFDDACAALETGADSFLRLGVPQLGRPDRRMT
jgi:EAL domain-containing protein (putative c-di-GMP-specific phosphodiesterase class I)